MIYYIGVSHARIPNWWRI